MKALLVHVLAASVVVSWWLPVEAGATTRNPGAQSPSAELRRVLATRLSQSELNQLRIPFEADADVRRAAARATKGAVSDKEKLAGLQSFFRQNRYREQYTPGLTQTAVETFRSGRGDCQSYASLFIAMARSVGLRAFYLDASEVVNERKRQGRELIESGHILVGVRVGPEELAVDFDGRTRDPRRYRVMTDPEALADFYNNIGYLMAWEHRLAGGMGSPAALQAFTLATRIAPRFVRAWNNLGVARARQGKTDLAEHAYRKALRIDPAFAPAWANLGHLLTRRGQTRQALAAFQRAVDLQPDNVHFRVFLAKILLENGELDRASQQLAHALTLDDNDHRIHLLIAQVQLARGDPERARKAAQRVLDLVPGQRDASVLLKRLRMGTQAGL